MVMVRGRGTHRLGLVLLAPLVPLLWRGVRDAPSALLGSWLCTRVRRLALLVLALAATRNSLLFAELHLVEACMPRVDEIIQLFGVADVRLL